MKYKKVVVAGGGILGSQIAFQTAYTGFDVTVLIREDDSKEELLNKFKNLSKTYKDTIEIMSKNKSDETWARGISPLKGFKKEECLKKVQRALDTIKIETNQEVALKDADLLIESITELEKIKEAFYKEIAPKLDEKTVVVTNSSTLLPSKLEKFTGRGEKYLALHFANAIWKNNIAEVMKHSGTEDKYFNEIIEFAEAINMIPLAAREEKAGYLLNSLLVPFLLCAMDLVATGVSDPETIDKAWKYGTGAPNGPFEIIDVVGLTTAKNIVEQYQKIPDIFDPIFKKMMLPYKYDGMLEILNDYIDKGKLGKNSGEGFYKYK